MQSEDLTDSPLARLGGTAGVDAVVDELYRRAGEDPELSGYFHTADMAAQRRRLADMIAGALGGPPTPWILGLDAAHRGRGITHRHFSLMAAHLIDTLEHFGVRPDEADLLTEWFAAGRQAVVDGGPTAT
ncbi:MAG: group I truncated hemoglobin [Microthrixaceae bacterium]